jgi:nucleoside-diphosphate-sugar epimerase
LGGRVRVVVTGGDGFLGRHLVQALAGRGHAVVLPRGDVARPEAYRDAAGADLVYHLAARSHVARSAEDPVGTWENNVGSTLTLLEWARAAKPRRVVLLSSAHVYGPGPGRPRGEDEPWSPRSPYAASKAATEALGIAYAATYGLDVVRVRPFNVYGPGQAPGFLVPDILGPLAEGRAPRLGNPRPRRDFTYVGDAVDFLVRAGEAQAARGEAINLGSGRAASIEEVARLACRASGTGLEPTFAADGPADELVADARKAERLLGWRARVGLEEGLRLTWDAMVAAPKQ